MLKDHSINLAFLNTQLELDFLSPSPFENFMHFNNTAKTEDPFFQRKHSFNAISEKLLDDLQIYP